MINIILLILGVLQIGVSLNVIFSIKERKLNKIMFYLVILIWLLFFISVVLSMKNNIDSENDCRIYYINFPYGSNFYNNVSFSFLDDCALSDNQIENLQDFGKQFYKVFFIDENVSYVSKSSNSSLISWSLN